MGTAMLMMLGSNPIWAGKLAVLELPSDELACLQEARIGRETDDQMPGSPVGPVSQHGKERTVQWK